jgi:serine/threonine-protein kinase
LQPLAVAVLVGSRLGPYEITAQIGAGGMGEVYRATDTNLKRTVAIKVLPEAVSTDVDRLARFQREAEVLARLNHPNIASIYGLENSDGIAALVMELVEGPTLADRIAQGPLTVDEAVISARQIADALDAAHEQGIVHRDLKPANIKVTADGAVKVLDFGLAKVVEPSLAGSASRMDLATATSPAETRAGLILGTAAYMSPEQARGRRVDKRTDIWAFGCVLYEMLTGRRAFTGDDVVGTLAAVVKESPDWSELPGETPEPLRRLLIRLLEKDSRRRVRDIGDARAELDALDTRSDAPTTRRLSWIVTAAAVGLVTGALAVWMATRDPRTEPPQVLHVSVRLPPDQRIVATGNDLLRIAISPDGKRIVYPANRRLHLRPLDSRASTPIANTENATAPFFSPDGQSIGFIQNARLTTLPLSGGTPAALAEVVLFAGGRWGADGTIVYADGARGIFRVASTGGTPVQVAAAESGVVVVPEVLPDSKWVLYSQSSAVTGATVIRQLGVPGTKAGQFETIAFNLETGERRVILKNGPVAYLPTGHLMYGADQDGVFVAPFDALRAEVTGPEIWIDVSQRNAMIGDVSQSGTLVFVKILPDVRRVPTWLTREGNATPLPIESGPYRFPRLSPDGMRLAVTRAEPRQNTSDIWIYDVDGAGAPMRLTFDGQSTTPVWTSDGLRLAFSMSGRGPSRLFTGNTDGSGRPLLLAEGANVRLPYAWFGGNTKLVYTEIRAGQLDIGMVDSRAGDRLLLSSVANETRPDVSPDGRWLAYMSNESGGRDEIFVRPMEVVESGKGQESGKWQVSTDGGHSPVWVGGRELVYRAPGRIMSVTIRDGPTFRSETPRPLFADPYVNDQGGRSYDVAPDGRFLMLQDEANSADEIHLIVNWFEELKRQLQAK